MLPELDDIDWARLEHAYGKADDVPDMLRAMLLPEQASGAFASFDAAVNHQGWATPAATACMPWLVAALDEPGVPLARLVRTLADLSLGGNHTSWIGQRLRVSAPRELHEPVLGAHARLVELLGHADAQVRAAAALALAALPEHAALALPAIEEALGTERTGYARASLLLSLGALTEDGDELGALLGVSARASRAEVLAATCARVWTSPHPDLDDLVELLAEAGASNRAKDLPWAGGQLDKLADAVLLSALARVPQATVSNLLELADAKAAPRLVDTLMRAAFPPAEPPPERLGEEQRLALRAAIQHEVVLRGAQGDRLRELGLPCTARGLKIWMGDEPGGVLDAVESRTNEPLWRALRLAMLDEVDASELRISLEDCVAALGELVDDKHHFADVAVLRARHVKVHEEASHVPSGHARLAAVLADLWRPHGEAAREAIEARARAALDSEQGLGVATWFALRALAALGPLDPAWDPLVSRCLLAPPAKRAPELLVPILESLPVERREPLVLAVPLLTSSGSRTTVGGKVIFEWARGCAGEGWWYLPSCPTDRVLDAVMKAALDWSQLPPVPTEIPRNCHAQPHDPFPLARVRELVAASGVEALRTRLQGVRASADPALVATLFELFDDAPR